MSSSLRLAVAVLILAGWSASAAAQESLAAARQLYGSAAYDEALAALERLRSVPTIPADEQLAIDQYRALCLLALNRSADAERAIEAVVGANPEYRPDESEASPRIQTAFRDVRKRLLPSIVQKRYAAAKAAFDQKQYAIAVERFDAIVHLLEAPDLAEEAKQPPLSDMRTLIGGFQDLAKASIPPPPPPPKEPPPVPKTAEPPRTYTLNDNDVTPPVVVSQQLPPWPTNLAPMSVARTRRGQVAVVIGVDGTVESVTMQVPIAPFYDEMLRKEAKKWRYRPAMREGVPVKFMKLIQISFGG